VVVNITREHHLCSEYQEEWCVAYGGVGRHAQTP
jgi:hypothetical protein